MVWLSGQTLAHAGKAWEAWAEDPFPDKSAPGAAKRNRYFHYRAIARKLGMAGFDERAKLPCCVMKNILERYPDECPKVGFKRSRFDF